MQFCRGGYQVFGGMCSSVFRVEVWRKWRKQGRRPGSSRLLVWRTDSGSIRLFCVQIFLPGFLGDLSCSSSGISNTVLSPILSLLIRLRRDPLWTPHVYLVNEQESVVMGADKKDVLLTVEPDGTVVLSARSVGDTRPHPTSSHSDVHRYVIVRKVKV